MYDIKPLEEKWERYNQKKKRPLYLLGLGIFSTLVLILFFTTSKERVNEIENKREIVVHANGYSTLLNHSFSKLEVKAAKESYYPTIGLKGNYTYSSGDAINNDKDIDTDFADLGLFLNLPLYDASKETKLQEAKLDYIQDKLKIEDTKKNLLIKARELKKEISYLEHMLDLSRKNIKNQKRLLHIAKVSLLQGVFTEDEYLRYEDALADAKASYSEQRAKMWQDKAQLAVIYGNDLKEIVQ